MKLCSIIELSKLQFLFVKRKIIFSLKKYSILFPGTGQLIRPVFYMGVM